MTSTHAELKAATQINETSIAEFARNLVKPGGEIGISDVAVIRVAQGLDETEWIKKAIQKFIHEAKTKNPEKFKAGLLYMS